MHPKGFVFHRTLYEDSKRKYRVYTRQWLEKFDTLSYSVELDGLFCIACVIFPVQRITTSRAHYFAYHQALQ